VTDEVKTNVERDPYEPSWHLFGSVDSRKQDMMTRELDWVFDRNFPRQHEHVMLPIMDRALRLIGRDWVLRNSLLFDNSMLDELMDRMAAVHGPHKNEYVSRFKSLCSHENIRDNSYCWYQHLAMQSIVFLGEAMFFYVYGHPEENYQFDEVDGRVEAIDLPLSEIIGSIARAGELVVWAEVCAAHDGQLPVTSESTKFDNTYSQPKQQTIAARIRHQPVADLKRECFEFYKRGNYRSQADAARKFIDQLPPEKSALVKPSNAEKLFSEAIGKLKRQEGI